MSIPFNQDTSTQLTYTSFPYTITNIDNYASSNYANTLSTNNSNYTAATSNILKSLIDTTNTNLSTNYYNPVIKYIGTDDNKVKYILVILKI